jgi:hypothetical protein
VGGSADERIDLAALAERAAGEFRNLAGERGVEIEVIRPRGEVLAAVQPELADRLLFRLLTALSGRAEIGERLMVSAETGSDGARVSLSRPAVLRGLTDNDLFEARPIGNGVQPEFTLRLVRGLARIAGGDLVSARDSFSLVFPRG